MPVAGNPAGICGIPEYAEDRMVSHLIKEHLLYQTEAVAKTKVCHVGRNNQTRFWCGFCGEVRALQNVSGLEAWDERFTHIDEHFKKGQSVDDWIDDITHQRKGDAVKERKQRGRRTDDRNATSSMPGASQVSSTIPVPGSSDSHKRQRSVSGDRSLPPAQRMRGSLNQMAYDRGMWTCVCPFFVC